MGDQSGREASQLRAELQSAEQQVRVLGKRSEEQERQCQELSATCRVSVSDSGQKWLY